MNILLTLSLALLISACIDKGVKHPKEIIAEIVKIQFEKGMTREMLEKYFSSDLVKVYTDLGDKDFDRAFSMSNRKLGKLNFDSEKCAETTCSITYVLSYKELNDKGVESSEVNVKKIAQFAKPDKMSSEWKIVDLSDVKTHIDFK